MWVYLMNASFQYIHYSIYKYNLNLYITLFQSLFSYAITKKECSVTRQIPEADTCQIPV